MKRRMVWLVAAVVLMAAALAWGAREDNTLVRSRAPFRSVTSAPSEQQVYDTIAVSTGERVRLKGLYVFADDSAQTPTLRIRFMSSKSRTLYTQAAKTYTANQIVHEWIPMDWCFPTDTSVVMHSYIVGGAINTLDSVYIGAQYVIERP